MEPSTFARLQPQLYRLHGGTCRSCGNQWLGSRTICGRCRSSSIEMMDFESTGTLVAWTQSDRIPANVQGLHPHRIGLIRLDGGPLVLAIIADAQYHEIQLGEKGELVTRRISIESDESLIVYGYKFRPHALNHRSPQD